MLEIINKCPGYGASVHLAQGAVGPGEVGGLWYKPGKNFALKTPNHLHVDSAAVKPGGEQVAAITPLFL